MTAPSTGDTASNNLIDADTERLLVEQARRLWPELCASTSDRDRLAGWLLHELAKRLSASRVMLCSACLTEACAAGNLMCDEARTASLTFAARPE